jgi:hypothetical protein
VVEHTVVDLVWVSLFGELEEGEQGFFHALVPKYYFGGPDRDRMAVGYTTTYAISAYHH